MRSVSAPARRRARLRQQEEGLRGAARSVGVPRAAALTQRLLDPDPQRIGGRCERTSIADGTEESPLVLGPRETSSTHREVLSHPGVEARRQLAVQMFEEPGHHFLAGRTGLGCLSHGSVRSAAE